MDNCELDLNCLFDKRVGLTSDIDVFLHYFPWSNVLEVRLFIDESVCGKVRYGKVCKSFVRLFAGKLAIFKDYEWQLEYELGDSDDEFEP